MLEVLAQDVDDSAGVVGDEGLASRQRSDVSVQMCTSAHQHRPPERTQPHIKDEKDLEFLKHFKAFYLKLNCFFFILKN